MATKFTGSDVQAEAYQTRKNPFKPGTIAYDTFQKGRVAAAGQLEASPEYQQGQYTTAAAKALPSLYAPAYGAISEQVAPQFAAARNYLAANPYAARSGVASSLNRRLLGGAYGALAQSMGGASADVARGGLDVLSDLIRRRAQARLQQQEEERNKPGLLEQALGVAGSVVPMLPKRSPRSTPAAGVTVA
jgi:hypothetical protein